MTENVTYRDYHTPLPRHAAATASPEALQRKSQQLGRILVELGQELSSVATPQEAARMILQAADELLGWDACAVDLCDGDEGYSLISIDTIAGARKEFSRTYGRIRPESMFMRVLKEGAKLILRTPDETKNIASLRSFGDESHPSAALLFVPIRKGGSNIGMLTIQSYTYGFYDEEDLRVLQVLADYCSGCLSRTFAEVRLREAEERRRELLQDLQERERIMNHDLALAQELQQRFLPETFPFPGRLRCAAMYRACSLVGGDLYDIFEIGPGICGFYIADVSGHGVSAALVTAILKANVDRAMRGFMESASAAAETGSRMAAAMDSFVSSINDATCQVVRTGGFVTFLLGVMRVDGGSLYLANAGHNRPILRRASGSTDEIELAANIPLGLVPDYRFETAHTFLRPGDRIVLYTDGVTERLDEDKTEFGTDRLIELVRDQGHEDPRDLVRRIQLSNDQFAADFTPGDDQAILVVELLG